MPRSKPPDARDEQRTLAVGLVWGHLHAQQPEEAWQLAVGCLQLWPDDRDLVLMAAYAAAELAAPVDLDPLRRHAAHAPTAAVPGLDAWIALLERRTTAPPACAGPQP